VLLPVLPQITTALAAPVLDEMVSTSQLATMRRPSHLRTTTRALEDPLETRVVAVATTPVAAVLLADLDLSLPTNAI